MKINDFTIQEKIELIKLLESIFDLHDENELSPEITTIYLKLTTKEKEQKQ